MLDFGFYNMDCMEGMKQFPDKYFELAIVDPPYGDAGGGTWKNGSRFGERFDRYKIQTRYEWTPQGTKSPELVELGRRSSEKNCIVGRGPGTGLFRPTVSRLTEPDNLGGQLLQTSADTRVPDMAQDKRAAKVQHGDGGICLDVVSEKRKSV